jgi:hypothetical protein
VGIDDRVGLAASTTSCSVASETTIQLCDFEKSQNALYHHRMNRIAASARTLFWQNG